jgi:hypothetical protein
MPLQLIESTSCAEDECVEHSKANLLSDSCLVCCRAAMSQGGMERHFHLSNKFNTFRLP